MLNLSNNEIADISSLLENTSMGEGDLVDLRHNPLDDNSIKIHIAVLEERGVKVMVRDTVLDIPDANLRVAVEGRLGKKSGETITTDEMAAIMWLSAGRMGIVDLIGLEFATGLTNLNLFNNQISDLSPLSGLTAMVELILSDNQIVDISLLSGLTSLRELSLTNNQIVDISPLSGLTSLRELYLTNNQIVDISPLSGLTSLEVLSLANNQIVGISSLTGLTRLKQLSITNNQIVDLSQLSGLNRLSWLDLSNNKIADISPLLENSGLGEGDFVDLRHNPLDDDSINVHIIALKERGVKVLVTGAVVDIPDANLRTVVEHRLGKESGETITTDEMVTFYGLSAEASSIVDLTGLEFATKLTDLFLANNEIADLSPLTELDALWNLYLTNNEIVDLSPLSGLNNRLRWLDLSKNKIADISPLLKNSGLGEGDLVDLRHNPLDDDSINVHIIALKERGVKVLVTGAVVDIPDANLRAVVERYLGKAPGETITIDEMATLYGLRAMASEHSRSYRTRVRHWAVVVDSSG